MKTFSVGLFLAGAVVALACDLCAVYNVQSAEGAQNVGFSLGIAHQFTRFGTVQEDGHKVPNPANEYLNSSILQLVGGYRFKEWVSVQASLPKSGSRLLSAECRSRSGAWSPSSSVA